jgi:hypothetical protein
MDFILPTEVISSGKPPSSVQVALPSSIPLGLANFTLGPSSPTAPSASTLLPLRAAIPHRPLGEGLPPWRILSRYPTATNTASGDEHCFVSRIHIHLASEPPIPETLSRRRVQPIPSSCSQPIVADNDLLLACHAPSSTDQAVTTTPSADSLITCFPRRKHVSRET